MQIASVIVTWNQTELTVECLASLQAAGADLSLLWVIDNGSTVPAGPILLARFPSIHVIRLEDNRGFTGGANIGLRTALAHKPDAFFLFNNDAIVEPPTLRILAEALQSDPSLAAVAPMVYFAQTERLINAVGIVPDRETGRIKMIGSHQHDAGQFSQPTHYDALFGCALLIRRTAWEQIGEFWEPFFNYGEEVDWALRAREAGWKLQSCPQAIVWHQISQSLGHDSPLKTYLILRNQLWLRQRHAPKGWRRWRGGAKIAFQWLRMTIGFARRRQWGLLRALYLAGWDYLLGRSGNIRNRRLRWGRA